MTKQFLSEPLNIWDTVIFAMVPLGILTAVVSAIRVCGNASLRAFIEELRKALELQRSNSCLAPQKQPLSYGTKKESRYQHGQCEPSRPRRPWRIANGKEDDPGKPQHHSPNLSPNIGVKRQLKKITYAAAALGVILQTDSSWYHIIEQTTHEVYYEQDEKAKDKAQMCWVQPGGQKLGDQVFKSFVGFSKGRRYIKSSRAGSLNKSDRVLWITVIITIFGFVI
ncbi:uncharacterized protein DFL_009416 [Arthrobotrys flagrans]|uniref:Uncharacterized protein n=1 Tax=Arthrobotrys flagrans TaxID=97331 RepID=A0A436ZRK8_ARTFL|nr:hypothetical protein DFL_009416 [Arthrobotrys flagrans]